MWVTKLVSVFSGTKWPCRRRYEYAKSRLPGGRIERASGGGHERDGRGRIVAVVVVQMAAKGETKNRTN